MKAHQVLKYHEETKHHYHRYARSTGFMDWENQPNPFRSYEGAPRVDLPLLKSDPPGDQAALYRRNTTPGPLSLATIGGFLELSLGLSAWKEAGSSRWPLRMNPSSGNLHPTESHLVLPDVEGCPSGLYHYHSLFHALEQRAVLSSRIWDQIGDHFDGRGFLVALTTIFWRESWKYGERAWRYCNLDAGHAVAALSFSAGLYGWKVTVLDQVSDGQIETLLGLDRMSWGHLEKEVPDVMCWVHPAGGDPPDRGLPGKIVSSLAAVSLTGSPNPLSKEKVDWEIISRSAKEARKPETPLNSKALPDTTPLPGEVSLTRAAALIRQRRSGTAFDGKSATEAGLFASMLDKTMPRRSFAPFDAGPSTPRIDLLLFVHKVTGLSPGLYMYIRNPAHKGELQTACREDFLWRPMRTADNLFLLEKGDYRADAMRVSCGQEIAGFSSFSLGMIAEYIEVVEQAPYRYRDLFREAGMIGQVLYLEAEAHGMRGTGIGCYFDDAVHDIMGLKDNSFQSMYHFTVGKPVEDTRLITRPPYFHLAGEKRA